jgi:oligopeptide transport system permease protein
MIKFILLRILESIPVLLVILTITFFISRLAPGSPLSGEKDASPEVMAALMKHHGFDKPLYEQYLINLKNLARGDLGPSTSHSGRSCNEIIAHSFPKSLELGIYAMAFALFFGLSAGIIAALRQNSWLDYTPMAAAMTGICVPTFVIGPILMLVFALKFRLFDTAGWNSPGDRVLPAITLGTAFAAYIARLTRAGMLDVLNQDFIRTARAKGVPEIQIVFKHSLKGGLLPVIAFLGPALAGVISGSFVVESIFEIPGLGTHFINAALSRDFSLISATVLFYAVLIIGFNMLVDILQVWLNPKLRFED